MIITTHAQRRVVSKYKPASSETQEHGADEFAKTGRVDWVLLGLIAVFQIVVVEGGAG